ncbi:MAG: GAF and ANTAR domain-containing protein [Actinomycetota bacterium]|nr:GAF and ANTAR domain-containing protein [Actinomycetota bacterium]
MSKLEISPEILEALQKLSSLLDSDDAFERTLNTVVDLSRSTLKGCDSAGITLRVDGKPTTAAATDHYTLEIDRIQYQSGEGPCLTAAETGERQHIEAISEESRWPEFCRRAAAEGVRSGASFPLRLNGPVGALNLYSKSERAFDDESMGTAVVFARQASIALENAAIYAAARRLGAQLNEALASRDVIGRAKGILMEREGLSDAEAFEVLRRISQTTNVKLREVAQRVVDEKETRAV